MKSGEGQVVSWNANRAKDPVEVLNLLMQKFGRSKIYYLQEVSSWPKRGKSCAASRLRLRT